MWFISLNLYSKSSIKRIEEIIHKNTHHHKLKLTKDGYVYSNDLLSDISIALSETTKQWLIKTKKPISISKLNQILSNGRRINILQRKINAGINNTKANQLKEG